MHRLQTSSALRRFRAGTVLLLAFVTALAAFFGLGVAVVLVGGDPVVRAFVWLAATLPLLGTFYLLVGSRARCPLCMNPPLVPRRCQKHRKARTFLGSYRLRVALAVFFTGRFTCPYCGEATRMEVRARRWSP
jgi:hypothetical protein